MDSTTNNQPIIWWNEGFLMRLITPKKRSSSYFNKPYFDSSSSIFSDQTHFNKAILIEWKSIYFQKFIDDHKTDIVLHALVHTDRKLSKINRFLSIIVLSTHASCLFFHQLPDFFSCSAKHSKWNILSFPKCQCLTKRNIWLSFDEKKWARNFKFINYNFQLLNVHIDFFLQHCQWTGVLRSNFGRK